MEEAQLTQDVQRLKESLGTLPEPVARPILVVISGLPGTGKSYFSRRLVERLPVTILESDWLRKCLFPQPSYSARESGRLFRACHRLIAELLERSISVLLDATNLSERRREQLYHIADSRKAKLILVRVEAPPEVVRQRLEERREAPAREDHSDADWMVYQKLRPSVERLRHQHFAVDTSLDITPIVDKVVRAAMRP